jgi:FKBP-type peptidyl-prolyl cis-trans isomerase 2
MKSKEQQMLEEAYEQVAQSGNTHPKIGEKYIWMDGTPQTVTVTDIKETPYPERHYSDGSHSPAGKDITVEIEFVDHKGKLNRIDTRYTPDSFKPVQ